METRMTKRIMFTGGSAGLGEDDPAP